MTSKAIEELKRRRQGEFKKKNSQIPYAVIVTAISLIIYTICIKLNHHSTFWMIGLLFGITLQRSRFCFAASFRDPILVGSTAILKAILIALIVSTIGFTIVEYASIGDAGELDKIRTLGQVYPVGLHTVIGAIMFGIGMVIAGGCASGFLMRIGEGFLLQVVVLFGFLMGALVGTWQFEFWDKILISKAPTVFFPDYVDFPIATIVQVIVLVALYYVADWYDKKNNIMVM
ncbi:MAG: YeeE/YedE family protein [Clostridiaceae bacterium]|nr:YeeE/YedE family protein [Clostridiaceae bacterium]